MGGGNFRFRFIFIWQNCWMSFSVDHGWHHHVITFDKIRWTWSSGLSSRAQKVEQLNLGSPEIAFIKALYILIIGWISQIFETEWALLLSFRSRFGSSLPPLPRSCLVTWQVVYQVGLAPCFSFWPSASYMTFLSCSLPLVASAIAFSPSFPLVRIVG